MLNWLKGKMAEQSSQLGAAGLIMLPLLQVDGLVPHLAWPYGLCVILILFKEAPVWAKMFNLPIPPAMLMALQNQIQPVALSVKQGSVQPVEKVNE